MASCQVTHTPSLISTDGFCTKPKAHPNATGEDLPAKFIVTGMVLVKSDRDICDRVDESKKAMVTNDRQRETDIDKKSQDGG